MPGFRDLVTIGMLGSAIVAGVWYKSGKPTWFGSSSREALARQAEGEDGSPLKLEKFPKSDEYQASATVRIDQLGHTIPDAIYGVCSDMPKERTKEYGIPLTRWGGNTSSRYNWKINADNGARDWFFLNRGEPIRDLTDTAYLKHIRTNQEFGASTYQTIPMLGWVAKDNHSASFPLDKYADQQQVEPWRKKAGNGVRRDGRPIRDAQPQNTSVESSPEFVAEAVRLVVKHAGPADGSRGKAGVRYWVLDNEPMLWHETHRDVRSEPLGYDELWDRTVKYAEAIKKEDPTAKVAGFCSWGWTDFFYSAADEGMDKYATQADHRAHGRVPLAEWFIRKCGDYKKKHGKSLVDVFDFHWYPQSECYGENPYTGKGMSRGFNDLRLRSTRDLWDSTYTQESWCRKAGDCRPTELIRRVHRWIDQHNPGMEICIGEYNFGGGDNITGGLAQAEVFGVLAREKVNMAFIWTKPEGSQHMAWRLFRNYDGKGGRFGDRWLNCQSNHQDVSVFAAKRTKDSATTIAVMNKNLGSPCRFKLDVAGLKGKLKIWRFDQEGSIIEVEASATMNGTLELTLPAASATMVVVDNG